METSDRPQDATNPKKFLDAWNQTSLFISEPLLDVCQRVWMSALTSLFNLLHLQTVGFLTRSLSLRPLSCFFVLLLSPVSIAGDVHPESYHQHEFDFPPLNLRWRFKNARKVLKGERCKLNVWLRAMKARSFFFALGKRSNPKDKALIIQPSCTALQLWSWLEAGLGCQLDWFLNSNIFAPVWCESCSQGFLVWMVQTILLPIAIKSTPHPKPVGVAYLRLVCEWKWKWELLVHSYM